MAPKQLIDSSVFIDHARGFPLARLYLSQLDVETSMATHPAVVAEVLAGTRNLSEQREIDRLFSHFHIVAVIDADLIHSLDLLRQHRLSHGVGWIDCLIAATCLRLDIPIVTLNLKHFSAITGLGTISPY